MMFNLTWNLNPFVFVITSRKKIEKKNYSMLRKMCGILIRNSIYFEKKTVEFIFSAAILSKHFRILFKHTKKLGNFVFKLVILVF